MTRLEHLISQLSYVIDNYCNTVGCRVCHLLDEETGECRATELQDEILEEEMKNE